MTCLDYRSINLICQNCDFTHNELQKWGKQSCKEIYWKIQPITSLIGSKHWGEIPNFFMGIACWANTPCQHLPWILLRESAGRWRNEIPSQHDDLTSTFTNLEKRIFGLKCEEQTNLVIDETACITTMITSINPSVWSST